MARAKARFLEPMLLLRTRELPTDRSAWSYELKLDGYRTIAFRSGRQTQLRSRNDNDFNRRYPHVLKGLARLPNETVVDGEIVALDQEGRPSFTLLQNASAATPVVYYIFDVLILRGEDVRTRTLLERRAMLEQTILPLLTEPVRYTGDLDLPLNDLVASVRAHGLEGLVAKRRSSPYQSGLRSGEWLKMRVNRGQEFVIGGYTIGTKTFDAVVIGYYDGDRLIYAARTRNGFTPAVRAQLYKRFRSLEIDRCPFANLPEAKSGRWGAGLTAAKMADCRWLKPVLVGQFEFVEWTGDHHLRHTHFVALRDDKPARDVRRDAEEAVPPS